MVSDICFEHMSDCWQKNVNSLFILGKIGNAIYKNKIQFKNLENTNREILKSLGGIMNK